MARALTNVVGIDDAPFERDRRGNVPIVGAVYARDRFDGVLISRVRRDGANATRTIAAMIRDSRFAGHVRAVLLQGIAVAGFNVIDIHGLHDALGIPVLVVARKRPDMRAIRRTLLTFVPGGTRKWELIQRAGEMEKIEGVWVQRAGLSPAQAEATIQVHAHHGSIPEPLRVAHLIAGALADGESRGRV